MTFIPDPSLKNHVENKDIETLPHALLAILRKNDLNDSVAAEAAKWCYSQLPDAFQEPNHNIAWFEENDKKQWTEDYYLRQTSFTNRNFCLERFLHLVVVRNHLRDQGSELVRKIERPPEVANPKILTDTRGAPIKKNQLSIGMILLGAVVVLIAILIML